MGRRLEDQLHEYDVKLDVGRFQDLLAESMHGLYPNWNDEELMHRPTEALQFCKAIRQASGSDRLPDEVILRALSALRKNS